MGYRFAFGRPPAVAANAMVATSHPLAARAGVRMLDKGGNAADAALAAAAVLCVVEPMSTGLGGDLFALTWREGELVGLDAAGPAPRSPDSVTPVAARGRRSVTVPGAPAGWAAFALRYGQLGLDVCLADAIDLAERGTVVTPRVAAVWASEQPGPRELAPPVAVTGQYYAMPALGASLRLLAEDGPEPFYRGAIAEAIASVTWLDEDDLASYEPQWVQPLSIRYRGHDVFEMRPPTQGVVALEALGLLEGWKPTLANQITAARLALEDAGTHVRDGADVTFLLERSYLDRRRNEIPRRAPSIRAGTAYVCAVDENRFAVSLIQSLFFCFGSGVVAPETGIVLQNRGACFAVHGRVEPGKRPFHTIIPAMLVRDGRLVAPFGVVGGFLQAQAHVQLMSALIDEGLDPQAALEQPRFCIDGEQVRLEPGLWERADEIAAAGHRVVHDPDTITFGAGQAIVVQDDILLGGSDPRMDGQAVGY
jgi:gamma-glutamyltranspeptidase/glutathione hydrolase